LTHCFNELDFQISNKEIVDAIASTKTGKACGLDSISNEMLKHGQTSLLPSLCKLFNVCFGNGVFPQIWAEGYISPIFKNVDPSSPSNYRGITITPVTVCNCALFPGRCQYLSMRVFKIKT
jgi:hypothetical protein